MKKIHKSCGGIVYRVNDESKIEILLLHRKQSETWLHDSWHLPKGTQENNETNEETASREILEETGYRVEVEKFIGTLDSSFRREGKEIQKKTYYFLCRPLEKIKNKLSEHDEEKWVSIETAIKLVKQFKEFEKEEEIILKEFGRSLSE